MYRFGTGALPTFDPQLGGLVVGVRQIEEDTLVAVVEKAGVAASYRHALDALGEEIRDRGSSRIEQLHEVRIS
jgi:hypothetical protein